MRVRYEGDVAIRLVPGGIWKPGQEGEIHDEMWPDYQRLGFVKVRAGKPACLPVGTAVTEVGKPALPAGRQAVTEVGKEKHQEVNDGALTAA